MPARSRCCGVAAADVLAVQPDRAGRRPQAHQGLAQLGLPVALHAGDAEDLPGPDLEGDPVHRGPAGARRARSGPARRAGRRRGWPASLLTRSCTDRPTMSAASSASLALGGRSPTTLPRRMTVMRSAISWTSLSLCEMKTMDRPSARRSRMIRNRSSVSPGVSTAVGSSRISTLASRSSALMISTRCWTPTGRSSTSASGSTSQPVPLGQLAHVPAGPPPVEQAERGGCAPGPGSRSRPR